MLNRLMLCLFFSSVFCFRWGATSSYGT